MIHGRIHSIETMGLVDGPGIRTVFFLQGCPLKCSYCHNPDTQTFHRGTLMTPEEVVKTALRYKAYHQHTGGGVTFSGGEPLMQGRFLAECLKLLKAEGIHTAIDTSGYGQEQWFESILENTDCVLMDIKAMNETMHQTLTGKSMAGRAGFMKHLRNYQGKIWIRHVMVPGYTDNDEAMQALCESVQSLAKSIEKIEILPYHKIGTEKYSRLGLEDPLAQTPQMDKERAKTYEDQLMQRLEEWHKEKVRKVS